ncbi:MAG TPA: hypothetical protein VML92_08595 [Steroidobacteraceae bacterium]|nr:hypothetical protein [Steroidobacteraceae bacterium]
MRLPFMWHRSKAAALAATVVLHVVIVAWLVTLRFDLPSAAPDDPAPLLIPAPPSLPPPPGSGRPSADAERCNPADATADSDVPAIIGEQVPDWSGEAAEVAGAIGCDPF